MKLRLLSRRHATEDGSCDICNKDLPYRSKRRFAKLLLISDDANAIIQGLRICRGCIQEMLNVAKPLSDGA